MQLQPLFQTPPSLRTVVAVTSVGAAVIAYRLVTCPPPVLARWWFGLSGSSSDATPPLAPTTPDLLDEQHHRRPRRLSNGAAAQMLCGSMPPSKGTTNELIHTILRIGDIASCARFLSQRHQIGISTRESDLELVKHSLWKALTNYRHFRSVPHVVARGLTLDTEWHIVDANVDEHVHVHTEKNKKFSRQDVNDFFAETLLNGRLSPTRPLWDAHLFVTDGGGVTIVLRTHHALADGMTLMHVITSIFGDDSLAAMAKSPIAFAAKSSSKPSFSDSSNSGSGGGIFDFLSSLSAVLGASATLDTPTALYDKSKFELETPRDILFLDPIPRSAFDALKQRLLQELKLEKLSSTEVLHALLSRAWVRAANNNGQSNVGGAQRQTRFIVPFSVPVDPEILSNRQLRFDLLPRNYVGFVSCPLAVGAHLSESVLHSAKNFSGIKRSSVGPVTLALSSVLRYMPLRVRQQGFWDLASSHSLVFSSVAGPQFSAGELPFLIEIDAAMANGMPQCIMLGCAESFSLTITFNPKAHGDAMRALGAFWKEELRGAGLI